LICYVRTFFLEDDVNERSISHKLAEYLQSQFLEYHVDCEYNWQMRNNIDQSDSKNVLFTKEEERKFYPKNNKEAISDSNAHTIYPDIIIHKRGSNLDNLLCVEIKKSTNKDRLAKERDQIKLPKIGEKYNYKFLLYLEIPTGEEYGVEKIDFDLKENKKYLSKNGEQN